MTEKQRVRAALQDTVRSLLTEATPLFWRLDSILLHESYPYKPYVTAETTLGENYVRIHIVQYGADCGFRVSLQVQHGPNRSTACNGRTAPPTQQKEPNVVTSSLQLTLTEVENHCQTRTWTHVIDLLLTQAYNNLLALANSIAQHRTGDSE